MLPPIRLKKDNLLTINNAQNINNKNDLIKNESINLNNSKDINLLNLSFLESNNNNDKKNINIEAERKKPLRKKISNLNNKVIDIFWNNFSRKKNNPEINTVNKNNLITLVN